ncbi:MAG TPA: ScyD/ScyE family protein [Rubricoccaceae bacterium]|nr:ScyD/ScyE family protein [Rubricoccaceae bacterium]
MDTRTRARMVRSLPHLPALLLLGGAFLFPALRAQPLVIEIVTSGLANPTGVEVGPNGWVWVASAGSGNDDGSITVVTPDGVAHPFMTGLRSVPSLGGAAGVNQIHLAGDDLWIALGLSEEIPESYVLRVDVSGWTPGDPPLTPDDVDRTYDVGGAVLSFFSQTNVYDLTVSEDGQTVHFTDASANAVFVLDTSTGAVQLMAMLEDIPNPTDIGPSFIQNVPTGIVAHDGGFYVAAFTGSPFLPGLSRVYRIVHGAVSVYRDGLTSVTDLMVDPEDGQLVALEFAEFIPHVGFSPGTGRIVKLWEHGPHQTLADGLDLTTALAIRDDDHYLTSLFGLLQRGVPTADVDVTPDAPITSPGSHTFDATLTNNTDAPQTVTARWRLLNQGGQERRLPRAVTLTLAPGQSVSRTFTVQVQADWAFRVLFSVEDAGGRILDTDVVTFDVGFAPGRAGVADASAAEQALDALDLGTLRAPETASAALPATRLLGGTPNPFAGATTLTVALDEPAPVRLAVYDGLGREVGVLVDGLLDAGTHAMRFDGAGLPSGVYLARLTTGRTTETLRVTLLR